LCVTRKADKFIKTHIHTGLWAVIHVSLDQPYMQLCNKELAGCHSVNVLMHEYNTL